MFDRSGSYSRLSYYSKRKCYTEDFRRFSEYSHFNISNSLSAKISSYHCIEKEKEKRKHLQLLTAFSLHFSQVDEPKKENEEPPSK